MRKRYTKGLLVFNVGVYWKTGKIKSTQVNVAAVDDKAARKPAIQAARERYRKLYGRSQKAAVEYCEFACDCSLDS